jgi:hypothetical protein
MLKVDEVYCPGAATAENKCDHVFENKRIFFFGHFDV